MSLPSTPKSTDPLDDQAVAERDPADSDVDSFSTNNKAPQAPWRVRLELVSDPANGIELELVDEVVLGRGSDDPGVVDLSPYQAETLGVSRRHLMLRPTATDLFAIDLGSTNGTVRNGHSIGVYTPYSLANGDVLALGRLQLVIHLHNRPTFQTTPLSLQLSLDDALSQIVKVITSQLNLDEVLNKVAEIAMLLTSASEVGIWLADQQSGELFLEAERGIQDERIRRMRLPIREDTLAGSVMKTGKPLRTSHKPGEDQIKVKTHYLVGALVYVPLMLGGVALGVLSATQRTPGRHFTSHDEQLLGTIADFAAIAIQNARLYQATDKALARRVRELSALNEVAHAVSTTLDLDRVYEVLVAEIRKHWQVEAVRLYLRNERENILYSLLAAPAEHPAQYPLNKGIVGRVASSGQTAIIEQAQSNPDYATEIDGLDGQAPQNMVCVPLRIQARVVGVLALFNKADGAFSEEDVNLLKAFANPIAVAIENARLFRESERQRMAIQATAQTFSQPILIVDYSGSLLVTNHPARELLATHMSELFEAISSGIGRTTEVAIGEQTYLCSAEHAPDVGTIVVMQDVTYVKQLEQDRSDFLHMLSHDLKNPLTAITGWAYLLERLAPLNETGTRSVHEIVTAADRMLGMVNQLLTVARGDDVQLVQEATDLKQIVDKVLADVAGAAVGKNITIGLALEGDPYPILGDEMRLYHMILNVVDNAIKYSPKSAQVQVRLHFNEEDITIRVQDQGSGVPEKDLPHIFNKYYRGIQATLQPGAGVGLSVVRAIAEAHEGSVVAENLPDYGAAFIITLPGSLRIQKPAAIDRE